MMKWISILALAAVVCFGAFSASAGPGFGDGRWDNFFVLASQLPNILNVNDSKPTGESYSQVGTCDRMAADPLDPERRGAGVAWTKMTNLASAISACRAAVREQPNTRRLSFQLGRALHRNSRHGDAVPWYLKAANMGHMTAQNNLGFMYEKGLGVQKNDREAIRWYRLAARKGNSHAARVLKKRGISY